MANSRMKLKILSTEPPTEEQLLTILTAISPVAFRDVHNESFNAFAVLNNSEDYSEFRTPEVAEHLKQNNLRLVHDANAGSMNVFVTRVRPFNINLPTEELNDSINNANPFKVSSVFSAKRKGYVQGQLLSLKLTMETEKDISTILSEGVIINKLVYPPDLIHREEAIPYNQCYKCFEFGHETKYCTSPKAYCSQCAGAHNFRDCKSSYRKCKLCKDSHLAVSFQCPKRKKHIQKPNENRREQRKKMQQQPAPIIPSQAFSSSSQIPSSQPAQQTNWANPNLFPPLPPPLQSQQNNTTTQHSNINISTIKPHNTTTQYPNTNSTMNNTQNTNTVANHSSDLKEHGWEIQLSIMTKYAEMKSKGNPEVFLSVMNAFLVQQGIPQIVAPVCQIQGSPLKTNAQTSPTRPIEIIQSYVLPVSPPPLPLSQVEPTTPEEPIQNSPPHTPTSSQNSTSNTPTTSKGENRKSN